MRLGGTVVLVGALLLTASSAAARETSVWVQCDGLAKPEGTATSFGRLVAASASFGLLGLPEASTYTPAASGKAGVDACTAALADPVLDSFWGRKVSLLKARALHHLEANAPDLALADLKATHDAAAGHTDELAYDRSIGLSAKLFEAALLAKRGQVDDARRLAVQAADARPYSAEITELAFAVIQSAPQDKDSFRILDRLVALTPDALQTRAASRDEAGDLVGALSDWTRASMQGYARTEVLGASLDGAGVKQDPLILAHAALAAARAGKNQEARAFLASLDAIAVTPLPPLPEGKKPKFAEVDARQYREKLTKLVDVMKTEAARYRPTTEAFFLLNDGHAKGAYDKLQLGSSPQLPLEPALIDLLGRLSRDPATAKLVPANMVAQADAAMRGRRQSRALKLDVLKYAQALPPLEMTGGVNKYQGQVGFGLNPNGFKESTDKKTGVRTLIYSGGSSVPVNQELAMLRLAELARKEGKPGFLVLREASFQRYYVTTYGGVETSRAPSGYQVSVDFLIADPAALPNGESLDKDRVLIADDVFSALSPVYLSQASSQADGKNKR